MTEKSTILLLENSLERHSRQDGSTVAILPWKKMNSLSASTGLSIRDLETAALENGILPERYERNHSTLTCEDQLRLLNSSVAIIGQGGLGGTVTEILARTGVGKLTLVDGDVFEPHNLNRQLLSKEKVMGEAKAYVSGERVSEINPSVSVSCRHVYLKEKNAPGLLAGVDAVCDCLDTIRDRFILEDAAKKAHIPMISGAVAGMAGQTTIVFPGDPGLSLVYGPREKSPDSGSEKITGTLAPAVSLIASLMASDLILVLLGRAGPMKNLLRVVDLEAGFVEQVSLAS